MKWHFFSFISFYVSFILFKFNSFILIFFILLFLKIIIGTLKHFSQHFYWNLPCFLTRHNVSLPMCVYVCVYMYIWIYARVCSWVRIVSADFFFRFCFLSSVCNWLQVDYRWTNPVLCCFLTNFSLSENFIVLMLLPR